MKAVMISIQPQWVKKILRGEKTIEIRKTVPKLQPPFKCYIYCTLGREHLAYSDYCGFDTETHERDFVANGKVVAEFICDRIFPIRVFNNGAIRYWNFYELENSCVPYNRVATYIGANRSGYGLHISELKIYDKAKELDQFWKHSDDGERPCEKGKDCEYAYYDYSENCKACGIDFGGDECPYMKLSRPPQSWCYVEELK